MKYIIILAMILMFSCSTVTEPEKRVDKEHSSLGRVGNDFIVDGKLRVDYPAYVIFEGLPTEAEPAVVGMLWVDDDGYLRVSE